LAIQPSAAPAKITKNMSASPMRHVSGAARHHAAARHRKHFEVELRAGALPTIRRPRGYGFQYFLHVLLLITSAASATHASATHAWATINPKKR
jgi:hypothetical protein